MHNFVALADENPWLEAYDVDATNAALQARRDSHAKLVDSGEFWGMSSAEKEQVSPETHQVEWIGIRDAVQRLFSSMNKEVTPVNEYQAAQFAAHGITRRDPMMLSTMAILELEKFASTAALVADTDTFDRAAMLAKEQWLVDGMTRDEINQAFATRTAARL